MSKYELALVVNAKIEDDERTAVVDKCKALIERLAARSPTWTTGEEEACLRDPEDERGLYYFIQFDAETSVPAEIESRVRIMDNVMRYLVVKRRLNRFMLFSLQEGI